MKYTKSLVLLFVIAFAIQPAKAQVSNPDTMIHKLFASLKAKDEKGFVALYPTGPQFAKMMRVMMEGMLKSEQMKQMMAMDPKSKDLNIDSLINTEVAKMDKPEVFAEMQKGFGKNFQQILEKGEKKGVNWSTAKLVGYTTDTSSSANPEMEMFKTSGIKNLKGVIDFTVGDSAYQMSFDKVIYIPSEGGWFGGEFQQVVRKGESFAQNDDVEERDVMVEKTDEVVPPPAPVKPKAKVKTKTKTSSTKTKSKTKS